MASHRAGNLVEAERLYRQICAVDPHNVESLHYLGVLAGQAGRSDIAIDLIGRALALRPDRVESWLALGNVFEQAQRYDDAVASYAKAPGLAEAWLGRARALKRLNRPEEVIVAYRQALARGGDPEVIRFFLASLGAEPPPAAAPKRLISSVYDQHSDHYDQHMVGTLKYQIPDLLFDAIMRLGPSRNLDILDLGCGTGLLGALLHPLARTMTGVDISPKMLALARQRQIYDNLVCGDLIEVLQVQTKDFDLIVAADVLVYFGDLSKVFREARARLRDGGLFGFSVEAGEEQDFVLRATLRYAHSAACLRKLSQDHGLVLESIESKVLRHENGIDVLGHIAVLRRS
jgi:predicted TPR repeat methyltransferase